MVARQTCWKRRLEWKGVRRLWYIFALEGRFMSVTDWYERARIVFGVWYVVA